MERSAKRGLLGVMVVTLACLLGSSSEAGINYDETYYRGDANGDGSTTGDVDGLDGFTAPVPIQNLVYDAVNERFYGLVSMRAERDGAEEGRIYSIVCDVVDDEGNEATASCVVIVPHNKRKN